MSMNCPLCRSTRIVAKNHYKKAGGALGTVAGATVGVTGVLGGAEAGATAGLIFGPVGAAVGGIAGAVIGGILGGTAGCIAGSTFGEVVDANVKDNYQCVACGHTFSKSTALTVPKETEDAGVCSPFHLGMADDMDQ
jgi:DNA-directed RNA polymerase subunit RPC12/RpoP